MSLKSQNSFIKISFLGLVALSQQAFAGDPLLGAAPETAPRETKLPEDSLLLTRLSNELRVFEIVYPKAKPAKAATEKFEGQNTDEKENLEAADPAKPTLRRLPNQYAYISRYGSRMRYSVIAKEAKDNISISYKLDGHPEMTGATLRQTIAPGQENLTEISTPSKLKTLDGPSTENDERSSPYLDEQIIEVTDHTMLSLENSRTGAAYLAGFVDFKGNKDEKGLAEFNEFIDDFQESAIKSGQKTYLWLKLSTEEAPKIREVEEILVLKGSAPSKKDQLRDFKLRKHFEYKKIPSGESEQMDMLLELKKFPDIEKLKERLRELERRSMPGEYYKRSSSMLESIQEIPTKTQMLRKMKISPDSLRKLLEGSDSQEIRDLLEELRLQDLSDK